MTAIIYDFGVVHKGLANDKELVARRKEVIRIDSEISRLQAERDALINECAIMSIRKRRLARRAIVSN